MKIIEENAFSKAEYDEQSKIVYGKYVGVVDVEKSKQTFQAIVAFAKVTPVVGTCSDISDLKGTYSMLVGYIVEHVFPPLIENGLKKSAIVVSSDVFTLFATEHLLEEIPSHELQIFETVDEATKWLAVNE